MNSLQRNRSLRLGSSQRGTSLLEVLISVLIMAVGLLGIAAMQATALRNSQGSTERSQAVIQSYAIIDAMRANRAAALGGGYNNAPNEWVCAVPAGGTLATNDKARWLRSLKASLLVAPGQLSATDEAQRLAADDSVCGSIVCTAATGICVVGVRWDESRSGSTGGAQTGDVEYSVQTRVRL